MLSLAQHGAKEPSTLVIIAGAYVSGWDQRALQLELTSIRNGLKSGNGKMPSLYQKLTPARNETKEFKSTISCLRQDLTSAQNETKEAKSTIASLRQDLSSAQVDVTYSLCNHPPVIHTASYLASH